MLRLGGVVRHYDWGHPTAIPELLGVEGGDEPWAELWFGAHPSAPSPVVGTGEPLDAVIAADPVAIVGPGHAELPFLLKILAAAGPLSIQVHPSAAQARAGFDREEAAGRPIDAADRVYRDPHPKPELLCALTAFDALCGFRPVAEIAALLASLTTPALDGVRDRLALGGDDAEVIADVLESILSADARWVAEVVGACDRGSAEGGLVRALAAGHPGDPGVVVTLLLNRLRLEPGDVLALDAGCLHAYLAGVGVELMANSDNVVRGGLTTKHVDVAELLRVVDCRPSPPDAHVRRGGDETHHGGLTLHRLSGPVTMPAIEPPAIVLGIAGDTTVGAEDVRAGEVVLVSAADGPTAVTTSGLAFVAGT